MGRLVADEVFLAYEAAAAMADVGSLTAMGV